MPELRMSACDEIRSVISDVTNAVLLKQLAEFIG